MKKSDRDICAWRNGSGPGIGMLHPRGVSTFTILSVDEDGHALIESTIDAPDDARRKRSDLLGENAHL
jgi:hypothetical protein